MLSIIESEFKDEGFGAEETIDDLAREGARQMLVLALEAEVAEYTKRYEGETDEEGHRLVVRNGFARGRRVTCGAGTIEIRAPRVNDKRHDVDGERMRYTSKILPPYMRRSPKVSEVLPILYLRGLSTGDFREALPILLGEDASGLSPTTIARLTSDWENEYKTFRNRDLSDDEFVYIWVDGVHFNVRLEEDRLCTLVMIGVRTDGTKELITVEDGYRESTESWREVLRDLKRRGMKAPLVAVGDGALGFWAACRDVWPNTRDQRCWFHKMGNVLDALPKRLQGKAKQILRDIMKSETRKEAEDHIDKFSTIFSPKQPKAVKCLTKDRDALLRFFDFPAEHWWHLRTTNPIESAFATVRLRQRTTKGAGSRTKALMMAFKLLDMAQQRWRRINGPELLPLVWAGHTFVDGLQPDSSTALSTEEAA